MEFHWEVIDRYKWMLLGGLWDTITLTCLSMLVGAFLGLILCLMRISTIKTFRVSSTSYTEFIRNLPELAMVIWIFYALPFMLGIAFEPYFAGFLTLTLIAGAYLGEIFRSGIHSVAKNQTEGAYALGMNYTLMMRRVVLPQAFRNIIPAIMTQFVVTLKMSSLCAFIGVGELLARASQAISWSFRPLEIYTTIAFLYFMIAFPISYVVSKLEIKLRRIYG